MTWKADLPYRNEWEKCLWELVPYTRGHGLDLGCGTCKAYPHMIGVDNKKDKELFGNPIKPDVTANVEDVANIFALESMDFVFSSHTLEHVVDYRKVLAAWWSLVKVGGNLVLLLPHKDLYPNIGTKDANPDHKHDFDPTDIIQAMKGVGSWDLVRNENRDKEDEYSFFQVFKKLPKGKGHLYSYLEPAPEGKKAAVIRYGAWGDGLQASSVLPELKRQGYHITFYTTPRCYEVIKHDPHVDKWYLQDTDQVPNSFLGQFWDYEAKKYDKFINLSESVEGAWLPIAGKDHWHERPHSVRKKYLDANYMEFVHDLAELPFERPQIKFFSTIAEKNWAFEQKKAFKGSPVILWALAGSSVHKVWPHIDRVLAWAMIHMPECKIITVGDERCKMMEDAPGDPQLGTLDWDRVPCVVKRSGKWSIRQTLAFAEVADLVIGPETGVLNAVSMMDMPKICFLSHSSHNNLTRDWINTFALFPQKTACYPCHQLHYSWKHCHESKELPGIAQCQYDIPAEACIAALTRALNVKEKPRELVVAAD